MNLKNDEVDEALIQLENIDEVKEENERLNTTLNKLKGNYGEKETDIQVILHRDPLIRKYSFLFQGTFGGGKRTAGIDKRIPSSD